MIGTCIARGALNEQVFTECLISANETEMFHETLPALLIWLGHHLLFFKLLMEKPVGDAVFCESGRSAKNR